MALPFNPANQTNATMLRQVYSTLPQELIVYNALSGDSTNNYAHYERVTMGFQTLSALSAFAVTSQSAGNGIGRDLYFVTASSNKIVLSGGSILGGNVYLNNLNAATTYTIQLSDSGGVIVSTASTGVTAAPSSSVSYPSGFQVGLLQMGTGQICVASGTSPVVNNAYGFLRTTTRYSAATLMFVSPSLGWVSFGDMVT